MCLCVCLCAWERIPEAPVPREPVATGRAPCVRPRSPPAPEPETGPPRETPVTSELPPLPEGVKPHVELLDVVCLGPRAHSRRGSDYRKKFSVLPGGARTSRSHPTGQGPWGERREEDERPIVGEVFREGSTGGRNVCTNTEEIVPL